MANDTLGILIAAAGGYLVGSIPFGLIATRLAGLGDIRKIGSGNIGATNVLRTGNRPLAAATLILDVLKGALGVVLGAFFGPVAALVGGGAAFVGHIFPVWLRFRGGRGVATFLGVLVGLDWRVAIAFAVVWLSVAALTRFSSASALAASAAAPVVAWFAAGPVAALALLPMAALLWTRHAPNIRRLLAGTESRIGESVRT